MGTRRRWLAALAVAVVLATACSGDDSDVNGSPVITDPPRTSSSTSSTSSTTTTTVDPDAAVKAEVEEAYLAYWGAWIEIFSAPNPENPMIDEVMTDVVKEVTIGRLSDHVLNGRSVRLPDDPADFTQTVLEVAVEGDTATLEACLVDGSIVVENSTEQILNDELVTFLVRATMARAEGGWQVSESTILEQREGHWTCVD